MSLTVGSCVPLADNPFKTKEVSFKTKKETVDNEARQLATYLYEQLQILQARIEALENSTNTTEN